MLEDFKAFIARGNILDLAIAVIMGAAFGAIVKTFTDGIIMPVIGFLTGGIDFKDKGINLGEMPVSTPEQIAAPTPPTGEEVILTEIRDLLMRGELPGAKATTVKEV